MDAPFLQFEHVTKSFPGVMALYDVTFGVREGSVHALCGENGAGKSTLLKVLSGVHRPDSGSLKLGDKDAVFEDAAHAIRSGVAVIYQELHLVPDLTVAENLYLGHFPAHGGWVDRSRLRKDCLAMLEELSLEVRPEDRVGDLPIAQRQMVEIAKALTRDAKVIAFDEPTSSLSSREVESLFATISRLKDQGRVILYVSHRMDEVARMCDAATVLRDGKHVETFDSLTDVTTDKIVERMVGRKIEDIFHYRSRTVGGPVLEVEDLTAPGLEEAASITVKKGEIVGVFGLVGAGRTELLKGVFGGGKGRFKVDGDVVTLKTPRGSIRCGVVLCPEDRKKEGIIALRSVKENINLAGRRGIWIDERAESRLADQMVKSLGIKTPSTDQLVKNLSGGNQQKTILARWLGGDVKVILLDEPTRGIDVGAKSEIYEIIYGLAEKGLGVLLVSSELPEVMGVCDRILVMNSGRIVASVPREEATEEGLLKLALPGAA
ncbi:MAG: L-arabinose ABC transporter ATP-binding protein AraG [Armatimonadetes bacterium]|nr:L-arabinose ABC transporter ATP-binding protein AraG [Armatimonadota bacterium]